VRIEIAGLEAILCSHSPYFLFVFNFKFLNFGRIIFLGGMSDYSTVTALDLPEPFIYN